MPNSKYSRLKLYKILSTRFDDDEVRELCDYLKENVDAGIDHDNLRGGNKSERLLSLIDLIERSSRRIQLDEFVEAVRAYRPDIKEEHLAPALLDRLADPQTVFDSSPVISNYIQAFTWKDSFNLLVVRFARWAGWLYFVDRDLLDRYIDSQKRRAFK